MRRVLTAVVLIPFVVYVVLAANYWIFFAVLAAVASLSYREYGAIAAGYGCGSPGPLGYGAGLLLLVWRSDAWLLLTCVALVALTFAMRAKNLAQSLPRTALLLAGVLYIFGAWKCSIPLRQQNPRWLMYALLVNWTGDIGAYYVGKKFGRRKLAPRISPAKSWEGAAAAVVASTLIAGLYLIRALGVSALPAIGLTIAASVAGQLGDLAESAMKRGAGMKDSGSILPGHGGLLDRVDGTLFTLPLIYAYLKLA
jgi:phosphatidate cytidylyltransferase